MSHWFFHLVVDVLGQRFAWACFGKQVSIVTTPENAFSGRWKTTSFGPEVFWLLGLSSQLWPVVLLQVFWTLFYPPQFLPWPL